MTGICEICMSKYKTYPSWSTVRRTCSRKCMGIMKSRENRGTNHWAFGKPMTDEAKAKLSRASKGVSRNVGKDNPMYGIVSFRKGVNVRVNTGRTHFRKGFTPWNKGKSAPWATGEKNKNWKGGVTSENERIRKSPAYKEWRKMVFQCDDYTCVLCGVKGGDLQADHIKPFSLYPELRLQLSNGRTLCKPCHIRTPTYGYKALKMGVIQS